MGFFASLLKFIQALANSLNPNPTTNSTTTDTDTTTTKGGNKKKAICIAINDYPGTNNDLRGCVNDARNWANLLRNNYGFQIQKTLIDRQATKGAVVAAFKNLISGSSDGDILVVTYSGHGTQVADYNRDEPDGKDEAWCMYNGNLIDDDIQRLIRKVPAGVKLTIISDSCFSGTVSREFMATMEFEEYSKPRYMPPEDYVEEARNMSMMSTKRFGVSEDKMNHILLTGTDDKSYSYDAIINGQNCGAFSYHAIEILKKNPAITYNDFHSELRKKLPSHRFPQRPKIEGPSSIKNSVIFS